MNTFKIGDKVKIKQLSIEEFKELLSIKYSNELIDDYNDYVERYSIFLDKTYTIREVGKEVAELFSINGAFFFEELIKIHPLKDKLALIRELLR
jgi:hypothetical protein